MSVRGKKILLQLLNGIINSDGTYRGRLRGGIDSKTAAIKATVDLLARVRLGGKDRVWERKRRDIDIFIKEQRKLAGNANFGPGLRADSLRRLTVLEGFAPATILSDDAADLYTKQLVGGSITSAPIAMLAPQEKHKLKLETAEDILKRLGGE
jgi:hypothetical protein